MTDVLAKPGQAASGAAYAPSPAAPVRPRSRNHRGWLLALSLVLPMAGAGAWWWRSHTAATPAYLTAEIDRGPVVRAVTASGTVNPVLTVVVGSYVSGVIQNIACDYNTRVVKGQVCATIDPRPYQLTVEQSQASLATASAQLAKDQASLAYAELNYGRLAQLLDLGVVSRDTVDTARSQRDQLRAEILFDQATIKQRQAALDAARVNLGYTQITSPVDGIVVSRNVTIGQTVAASFQTPTLFLIAQDLTKMQVDTNVSESDIGGQGRALSVGDPGSFTVEAFPGRAFRGVVAQVRQAPQTVQNVVTYDVVVAVDNPELLLRPGMTATVKIVADRREQALRAPNAALRFNPGGLSSHGSAQASHQTSDRVWLLRGGHPVPVPVVVGLADDSYTELTAGDAHAGDQVVIRETASGARGRPPALPRM